MKINIEVKGADEAIGKINRFNVDVFKGVLKQIETTSKDIRNRERQAAPVRTGKYKKSIKRTIKKVDLTATVGPTRRGKLHPIAHLLERGTKAHDIHPYGNKKVTVRHPGSREYPHIEPAWDAERDKFVEGVKSAIKEAAR
ncbi:MAG: hypothetical protein H6Q73_919 [Firmicutes bacterium]|nr:hypothetical protein [Bacillota bacterium]